MNKLFVITFALLLIGSISATTWIAGEPYTIQLEKPFEYYSVVGNETPIIFDEITQSGNNITFTLNKYTQNDSFELIFFDIDKEIVVEHHYSSGGGSTTYVDKEILVEVPNYIDREVEVIKEVPTSSEPDIINEIPSWVCFLIAFLIALCFVTISILLIKSKSKENKDERRLENE